MPRIHTKFADSDDEMQVVTKKVYIPRKSIATPVMPNSQPTIDHFTSTFFTEFLFPWLPFQSLLSASLVCKSWKELVYDMISSRQLQNARTRLSLCELDPTWPFLAKQFPDLASLPSQLHLEEFTVEFPYVKNATYQSTTTGYQVQKTRMVFPHGTLTNDFEWTFTLRKAIRLYESKDNVVVLEDPSHQISYDIIISNSKHKHYLFKYFFEDAPEDLKEEMTKGAMFNAAKALQCKLTEVIPIIFIVVRVAGLPINVFHKMATDFVNLYTLETPAGFDDTFKSLTQPPKPERVVFGTTTFVENSGYSSSEDSEIGHFRDQEMNDEDMDDYPEDDEEQV